jgi:hypothetical protein
MKGSELAPLILVGTLSACPREIREEPVDVASLNLACGPVSRDGVQCRLLALSRDVARPPRDVTGWASWHVTGAAKLYLAQPGVMRATGDGEVVIDTRYRSRTARVMVRLAPEHSAQLLATVRGAVYGHDRGRLRPMASARVEVVDGPNLGKQTTTHDDGTYELPALVPGDIVIRATKIPYVPTDLPARIGPGDNRISVALETRSPADTVAPRIYAENCGSLATPAMLNRCQ